MSNALINLIINIFLMVVAIFSVRKDIYDRTAKGKIWNKINRGGWFLIFCALYDKEDSFLIRSKEMRRKMRLSDPVELVVY